MCALAQANAIMLEKDLHSRKAERYKNSSAVLLRVWSPVETLSGEFL